jgi:hypothetical protein
VTYGAPLLKAILAFLFTLLAFSALIHTQALTIFPLVPFFIGLMVGLMMEDSVASALISAISAAAGTLLFAHLPSQSLFIGQSAPTMIDARFSRMAMISPLLPTAIISALAGSLAARAIRCRPILKRAAPSVLLLLVTINYIALCFTWDPGYVTMLASEPSGRINHDGVLYIKIFYNLEHGMNYYTALGRAYADRTGTPRPPDRIQQWRLPTAFMLWSWLFPADCRYVFFLYILLSSVTLWVAFLIARTAVGPVPALMAPLLLAPYFLNGAVFTWFSSAEFWGLFSIFWGLLLYIRKRESLSAVFFACALLFRELYALSWLVPWTLSVFTRHIRKFLLWLSVPAPFALLYLYHYFSVRQFLRVSPSDVRIWMAASWDSFLLTARFGMWFLGEGGAIYWILLILGIAGAALHPDRRARALLLGLILVPCVAFQVLGHFWAFYWGIVYMPVALTCIPFLAVLHKDLGVACDKAGNEGRTKGAL